MGDRWGPPLAPRPGPVPPGPGPGGRNSAGGRPGSPVTRGSRGSPRPGPARPGPVGLRPPLTPFVCSLAGLSRGHGETQVSAARSRRGVRGGPPRVGVRARGVSGCCALSARGHIAGKRGVRPGLGVPHSGRAPRTVPRDPPAVAAPRVTHGGPHPKSPAASPGVRSFQVSASPRGGRDGEWSPRLLPRLGAILGIPGRLLGRVPPSPAVLPCGAQLGAWGTPRGSLRAAIRAVLVGTPSLPGPSFIPGNPLECFPS